MTLKQVLLIDQSVPDYQVFVDSANESTGTVLYTSTTTRQELMELIREKVESVERVGVVCLKDAMFVEGTFPENTEFLISLIQEFQVTRIDFLACNTLDDPQYKDLYEALERETGVIVGASSDRTGNIKYGGDWVMESTKEDIEYVYFTESIEYYQYLLDSSQEHLLYVKNGVLYALGSNSHGQCGTNNTIHCFYPTPVTFVDASGNSLAPLIKTIGRGKTTTIILLTDGTLWHCGNNGSGQYGISSTNRLVLTKSSVTNVAQVSCGEGFTLILKNDGTLWVSGYNANNYGLNTTGSLSVFTVIPITNVVQMSCGWSHAAVIKKDGTLWTVGLGSSGQLGLGNNSSTFTFTQVTMTDIKKVVCGTFFTMVLQNDGTLWGTGQNGFGRLGIGITVSNTNVFRKATITNVVDYDCGSAHSIALKTDGTIWVTGQNICGQLGLNDFTDRISFTQSSLVDVAKVSCGFNNSYVYKADGTLWATGDNSLGMLNSFSNTVGNVNRFGLVDTNVTIRKTPRLANLSIPYFSDITVSTVNFSPPTSLSGGAITYTVNNTSLATITGNTLTRVNSGKVVIFVSQALTANYDEDYLWYIYDTSIYETVSNFSIPPNASTRTIEFTPATSNSGNPFTYTSSNTSIATISGTTLNVLDKGLVTLVAKVTDPSYNSSASFVFDTTPCCDDPGLGTFYIPRNASSRILTLTPPTSNSSGAFTYTSSNTAVATISGSTLTVVGSGSTTITATQAAIQSDTRVYQSASKTDTITTSNYFNLTTHSNFSVPLNLSSRTITLVPPTSNSSGAFTYTSSNTGVATVSGTTLTVIGNGTTTITATQAATPKSNQAFYQSATSTTLFNTSYYFEPTTLSNFSVAIPLNRTTRTITLTPPTTNSSGAFTYTSSNTAVATISGTTLTVVGKGTTYITATQAATAKNSLVTYSSANTSSLLNTSAYCVDPTLSNFSIPLNLSSRIIPLVAPTSNSTGSFTYSSNNLSVATISSNNVVILDKGTTIITATQATTTRTASTLFSSANTSFLLDTSYYFQDAFLANFSIPVNLSSRTLSIMPPTSNSSGLIYYTSNNLSVATISDNTVNVIGPGNAIITATQLATPMSGPILYQKSAVQYALDTNDYYGRLANFSIPIDLSTRTIPLIPPTSTSEGTFTYTSSDPAIANVSTLSGVSQLIVVGNGTATITATKSEPNASSITTTFNTSSYFENPVLSNFSIPTNTTTRTITLVPPSSNSSGAFTYSSSNTALATISGSTLTVVGSGTVNITATQESAPKDSVITYNSVSTVFSLDTSPIFRYGTYETLVFPSISTLVLPINDPNYTYITNTDEGNRIISLSVPFVFNQMEYYGLFINYNGGIRFLTSYTSNTFTFGVSSVYQVAGLNAGILPFFADLVTDYDPATQFISYKIDETAGVIEVYYNTSLFQQKASSSIMFKVTLFLKNHPDSGNALIDYGTLVVPESFVGTFVSGVDYEGYSTIKTFTTDDWFTQNYTKELSMPMINSYPLTSAQLQSISNKSILYRPSNRVGLPFPAIPSWSISPFTSKRVLLTPPVSNSSSTFTYTTSDSSVATIDGNYLVLYKKGSVRVTATQPSNDTYNFGSAYVDINVSSFDNLDFIVPTVQWTIPNNSTTRRILMNAVSTNPEPFTYTASDPSVTFEGTDLVLANNTPVTITATQPANNLYESASVSILMDSSYFSQIVDFRIVPTIQPWTILNNSPTRVIQLTTPVSNSPAPFTFTTSNASVATIENGHCLLIYSSGYVTVTATQPAIQGTNYYYEQASTSVNIDPSYFTFMTDICFPAGTPILTDQGTFPIETLTTQTLNQNSIVRITKTLGTEEQLVCFEKDALGKDQPSQLTVMTMNHRVEKDGKMVKAKECLNGTTVHAEWYMGEYLYNVLLETHSVMNVNGLICETLDPENDVAKFYA